MVHFLSYRAYGRARGPHMVSDICINRWSVRSTHGSPPLAMPSPRYHSPSPLPAHHSTSASSYVGSISSSLVACPVSPPLPSPVNLVCVYCGELGHSIWLCNDYNIPCSPNSSQAHPPATTADSLPIPNGTPIPPAMPLLPQVIFNQECPTIPRE